MNNGHREMGTMRLKRRLATAGWVIIIIVGMAGWAAAEHAGVRGKPTVDSGIPSYTVTTQISERLTIAGSDYMQPLMVSLATEFRRLHPTTTIAVQGGGTDAALDTFVQRHAASRRGDGKTSGHFGSNDVMLLAASRPLTQGERETFSSRFGYEPMENPIAVDAVAIYVNRENPLQGLTLDQVDAIFGKDHKRAMKDDIVRWGQLGLGDGWEQQSISLYGRDKRSGTRTFFKHVALLDGDLKATVKEQPGSASEILAIARDPLGIGYGGIGFHGSTVKVVPVAEQAGMPYVEPDAATAVNGSYPLHRHLYLYLNRPPDGEVKPVIMEFLKFVNSREGQALVVKSGVYPLPAWQVAKNQQALTGSTFAAGITEPR